MIILAKNSQQSIELQYVPDALEYSRRATHANLDVIGRNIPRVHYTGGNTTLSFTIEFTAEMPDKSDVITKCTWLESLAMTDGYNNVQEPVILIFGEIFKRKQWVVRNVDISYSNMHLGDSMRPAEATVQFELQLISDYNINYRDVRYRELPQNQRQTGGLLPAPSPLINTVDTNVVSIDNMYAQGEILTKLNGDKILKRKKLELLGRFLKDASYRMIIQGESLEAIAYTTLREQFPNASKYWWILSDLNGVNFDPIDIMEQVGREILIPNIHEVIFDRILKV